MKKSDLKPGMVVELRNGTKAIIIEVAGDLYYTYNEGYNSITRHFNEDLTQEYTNYNIDKVYKVKEAGDLHRILEESFNSKLSLIWERPKPVELTMQEIADKFGIDISNLKIKK